MTHITARFLEQEERVVFTMGPVGFLYSLLRPSSVFRPPVLQKQTLAVGCVGYRDAQTGCPGPQEQQPPWGRFKTSLRFSRGSGLVR